MSKRHPSEAAAGGTGESFETHLEGDLLKYLPVKFFPAVSGLVSIILLTRFLLPEKYGIYSVVMTTCLLVVQLMGSWLPNSILFVYPDYRRAHMEEFERKTLRIQAMVSLPALVIGAGALLAITRSPLLSLLGSAILVFTMFQATVMGFLQSNREVITQAVAVGIQSIVQVSVLVAGVLVWDGKEGAALVSVLAGLLGSLLFLAAKRWRNWAAGVGRVIPQRVLFRRLFDYGMPMCLWYFAFQFCITGDRLLLQHIRSAADVGPYASFRDLAIGGASLLTMPMLLASHPIIMTMWKENRNKGEIEDLMSRNITLLALLFVPLLLLIDLCGQELVGLLFGANYRLSRVVMLLVVLSVFLSAVAMYVQKGLEVTGRTMVIAAIALGCALFSLLSNMLVIHAAGVAGAASVVILSQLLYLVVVWRFSSGILKVKFSKAFFMKMVGWAASVELLVRSMDLLPFPTGGGMLLPFLRVAVIAVATIVLFALSSEFHSIGQVLLKTIAEGSRRIGIR